MRVPRLDASWPGLAHLHAECACRRCWEVRDLHHTQSTVLAGHRRIPLQDGDVQGLLPVLGCSEDMARCGRQVLTARDDPLHTVASNGDPYGGGSAAL